MTSPASNPANATTAASSMDGSGAMFDTIAHRYDLLNRLISFGLDKGWRRKAVRLLGIRDGDTLLDLATGTADLAIDIARNHPAVRVQGLDPSQGMLDQGVVKVARLKLDDRVTLTCGDGQDMPFEDNTFDGAIIGFGIRNFPDRPRGLSELARVTRPGRKVVILELSEPRGGLMSLPAKVHIHGVVPLVGRIVAGSEAYDYLQRSIQAFPPAETFADMMRQAGMTDVQAIPVTFGVAHIYVGTAP